MQNDQSKNGQPVSVGSTDGSAPAHDITEDEEYQKFIESMVPHCHCAERHRPCDGVLAGGLCDNNHDSLYADEESDE